MSDAIEIGLKFVELAKQGKDSEIINQFYAEDTVSIEAVAMGGMPAEYKGLEAIRGKHAWWNENMEFLGGEVKGPYPNLAGDQFAVHFSMEMKNKKSGEITKGDEVAMFTIANGKIVKEEFFYMPE